MDKVKITNTDLVVTQIGLGSSHFGTHTDKQTAIGVLDKWYAAGGNLIDTAHIYGANKWTDNSPSEEVIGEWLEERGVHSQIVLCTKGGRLGLKTFVKGFEQLQKQKKP